MDDFPKLVNNQAENSLRERERGEMGMRASRVFPTFRIPPSFVGAKGRDRLHRCKLDARFLSTRTNGRRASKSALFIPRLESTTVSRFSRRKIVDIRSRVTGNFANTAITRYRGGFARGFALADRGGGERGNASKNLFSLQMENSRSHALYHIAINWKTRGVKKAYVAYVSCLAHARETHRVCDRVFARPIHVSSVSLRTYLPT